jgi:hypothetical protein
MQNKIVNTPFGKRDLNDLPIKDNVTKASSTHYENVALAQTNGWQDQPEYAWHAAITLTPEEATILNTRSNPYKLAICESELEAAHVASEFNKDRANNIRKMIGEPQCSYTPGETPNFEFEPITSETVEAKRAINIERAIFKRKMQNKIIKPISNPIKDYTKPTQPIARHRFWQLADKLPNNAVKIYPTLSNDWDVLTVDEFKLRYGIE